MESVFAVFTQEVLSSLLWRTSASSWTVTIKDVATAVQQWSVGETRWRFWRIINHKLFETKTNKSLPRRSWKALDGQLFGCYCVCSARKCVVQELSADVLVSSPFWSSRTRRHGPCMCVMHREINQCKHQKSWWTRILASYNYKHQLQLQARCACFSSKLTYVVMKENVHRSALLQSASGLFLR